MIVLSGASIVKRMLLVISPVFVGALLEGRFDPDHSVGVVCPADGYDVKLCPMFPELRMTLEENFGSTLKSFLFGWRDGGGGPTESVA